MKHFIIVFFLLIALQTFSQIISPSGNNLFYYNGAADVTFRYADRGTGGRALVHDNGNILALNYANDFTGGTRIGNDVFFKDGGDSFIYSGKFGIGTATPDYTLTINGNLKVTNGGNQFSYNGGADMIFRYSPRGTGGRAFVHADGNILALNFGSDFSGGTRIGNDVYFKDGGNSYIYSGNLGIGTASPAYKLDVIGTIRAREIIVDLNGADFVFEKDYKLMPLNELERFVKEQKHLPEIVPANEMSKNGTELGNLNSKLLQKMEEMTLYMIDQNKKIEILEQTVKTQTEKIEKLESASK